MMHCPRCRATYDETAYECWRCKRPGVRQLLARAPMKVVAPAPKRKGKAVEIVVNPVEIAPITNSSIETSDE